MITGIEVHDIVTNNGADYHLVRYVDEFTRAAQSAYIPGPRIHETLETLRAVRPLILAHRTYQGSAQ